MEAELASSLPHRPLASPLQHRSRWLLRGEGSRRSQEHVEAWIRLCLDYTRRTCFTRNLVSGLGGTRIETQSQGVLCGNGVFLQAVPAGRVSSGLRGDEQTGPVWPQCQCAPSPARPRSVPEQPVPVPVSLIRGTRRARLGPGRRRSEYWGPGPDPPSWVLVPSLPPTPTPGQPPSWSPQLPPPAPGAGVPS